MDKSNNKININVSKSNRKITAIKPIIKLETNPDILKNLKEVFSSQKIKEQIKSAVNKLQADDALPSPKRMNVIRPGHMQDKSRLSSNSSVKETLRTTILHKNASPKIDNKNTNNTTIASGTKLEASSTNSKSDTKSFLKSKSFEHQVPNSKILNKTYSNKKKLPNSSANNVDKHSGNKHSYILNFETTKSGQNLDYSININVVNSDDSNKNTSKHSHFGKEVILNNFCKNTNKKDLKLQENNKLKGYKIISEIGSEPESEIGRLSTDNIRKNNLDQNKCEKKTINLNAEKHNDRNDKKNATSTTNEQIYTSNFIVEDIYGSQIESEVESAYMNYTTASTSRSNCVQYAIPEIKIQKASINIQGKEVKNYRAHILNRKHSTEQNSSEKTEVFNMMSPIEKKTTITHNFIKTQLEKNSIFKSPENPPKQKIDDIKLQEIFLINEIEDQRNPNDIFIKSEENFDVNLQDITNANDQSTTCVSFAEISPERSSSSSYSPKLIQDLDSNKIFQKKSIKYSPKLVQNIDANHIFNQNFTNIEKGQNSVSLNSAIGYPLDNSNLTSTPNKEIMADAVDFLCNLNSDFIKNEEDDISDTSSTIDDAEILKPEDFLQNISQSFVQLNVDKDTNENKITMLISERCDNSSVELSKTSRKEGNISSRSAPIVIENKILAESEKVNLDLCLGNVVKMDEIVNTCSAVQLDDNQTDNHQFENVDSNVAADNEVTKNSDSNNSVLKANIDRIEVESFNNFENFPLMNEGNLNKYDITIKENNEHKERSEVNLKAFKSKNISKITTNVDEEMNPNLSLKNNILTEDEVPYFEEEVISTTELAKTSDDLNFDAEKQQIRHKTMPISNKRPRIRGGKINLVERRKVPSTKSSNEFSSKKSENEENPSISPHASSKRYKLSSKINEDNANDPIKTNEELSSKNNKDNIKDPVKIYELSFGENIEGNKEHSIVQAENDNKSLIEIERNDFRENIYNNQTHDQSMDRFLSLNLGAEGNVEKFSTTSEIVFNDNKTINSNPVANKDVFNHANMAIINNIDSENFFQSNCNGDESNGSDVSTSVFIGFDLSLVKQEDSLVSALYNSAINRITSKLTESKPSTNFAAKGTIDSIVEVKNEKAEVITNYIISEIPTSPINKTNTSSNNELNVAINRVSQNPIHQGCTNFPEIENEIITESYSNHKLKRTSFGKRKISKNSQNSRGKIPKTLTSDSDSLGEDDSVPLKKRPIRVGNLFSNNSASESEQTRKENRIRILDKRDYFSSRKDSENSTASDHQPSMLDFGSFHTEVDNNNFTLKKTENNDILLKEDQKCFQDAKQEKKNEKVKKFKTSKQNVEFLDNITHSNTNKNNTTDTKIETKSVITKKCKSNPIEKQKNEFESNACLSGFEENLNESYSSLLQNGASKFPSKENSINLGESAIKQSKKRKKQQINDFCSNDSILMEKLNCKDILCNQKPEEKSEEPKTKKKARGRKSEPTETATPKSSKQTKKIGAFEKFYSQLLPVTPVRRKVPAAVNSSLLRKLHPNLLLIDNRCDIDNFKVKNKDEDTVSTNEVICGLCNEAVLKKASAWSDHLYTHYGVGWIIGEESIDVTQYNTVLNFMINFMKVTNCKSFKCRMCQNEFKSALGTLSHILTCGLEKEERRNNTHVVCENCEKHIHYVSFSTHVKNCTSQKDQAILDEINILETQNDELLNNNGRFKRKSKVKAENKLKEIEIDIAKFDIYNYIKTIHAVRGGKYRSWKKKIDAGIMVKCCAENCEEMFNDLNLLKKHINNCNKILKTTFQCLLCKFIDVNVEVVKTHINEEHEKSLKNLNDINSDSEIEFSKKDLSESSEECSSGVDENEVSVEEEEINNEEYYKKKKGKKSNNNIIKRLKAYPSPNKSRNLLPSERNSITEVLRRTREWSKYFFNHHFTSEVLFRSCVPNCISADKIISTEYRPINNISMKFSFSKIEMNTYFGSSKWSELLELECFKWITNEDEILLYIGGPITALEWVPLPDSVSQQSQYLAISYKSNYNKFTRVIHQKSHKTLILIFKLKILGKNFDEIFTSNSASQHFSFEYGITFENGPVHDMKFLPSGGYNVDINRLGLLAVASANNDVNIYSLPIEVPQNIYATLNSNLKLIVLQPVMKLTLNFGIEESDQIFQKKDHYFVQCCKIAWSMAKGHNIVATGYANGFVALWNIDAEHNLNCFQNNIENETLYFSPISYFKVGDKFITGLDFHYDYKEPRWLSVGSYSRTLKIFDIENTSYPTLIFEDIAKSFITSSNWPIIWENIISTSSSDLCLAGPLTTSPMQLLFSRRRCGYITSGVTCIDYNPWNNVCIVGTENGDFSIELRSEYNLDCTLKRYVHSKIVTYTDLVRLDGNDHALIEKLPNANKNNKMEEKTEVSEFSTSTDKNLEPMKFFEKDYKNKYGLVFGPSNFNKMENKIYASEKRNSLINLNYYVRINSVACNTNFHGSNFYTFGYENGFIRILYKKIPKL